LFLPVPLYFFSPFEKGVFFSISSGMDFSLSLLEFFCQKLGFYLIGYDFVLLSFRVSSHRFPYPFWWSFLRLFHLVGHPCSSRVRRTPCFLRPFLVVPAINLDFRFG